MKRFCVLLMVLGAAAMVQAGISSGDSIVVNFDNSSDTADFIVIRDDVPDTSSLGIAQNAAKGTGATAGGGLEAVNVGSLNQQNDLAALYAPGGSAANGAISLSAGDVLTMSMKFKVLDNTEAATPRLGIASFSDAAAATSNWSVLDINQGKDMIGHNAYADGIAINVATGGDKTFNIVNSLNGTGRTLIADPSGPYDLVDGAWYQYILEITKSATVGDFDVAITLNALSADGMSLVSQVGSLAQTITNAGLYADGDVIAGLTIVHDGDPDTVSNEYDDLTIAVRTIPEPATLMLLGIGAFAGIGFRRK